MLFGTFDIIHAGHIHVFKEARKYGDYVVAVIARDKRIEDLKGFIPTHSEAERMEILQQISLIDRVVLGDTQDVYKRILEHRPDVIVLGYDQEHYTDQLGHALAEAGLHNTRTIRIKPYKNDTHKSGEIRKKLLGML